MKGNAIIRIVLFSIAIFILGSILLGVVSFDFFTFNRQSVKTSPENVLDGATQVSFAGKASDIRHLEIEWAAGSITILPNSGSDQILISESVVSDEKHAMHITQSGNKLKVEYCDEDGYYIGFGKHDVEKKDLSIYVPTGWTCDTLEIDAAAARVNVTDLSIREVDFDGASAICSFESCQIDSLDVDTASGDVTFSGTLEELDFDAMSACFDGVFHNVPSRMDMDSMSGDLDITLPEDSGFSLQMDAMSSDFSSEFATTMQNGHYVHGDGHCRINVSAMSGDVCIRKAAK